MLVSLKTEPTAVVEETFPALLLELALKGEAERLNKCLHTILEQSPITMHHEISQ